MKEIIGGIIYVGAHLLILVIALLVSVAIFATKKTLKGHAQSKTDNYIDMQLSGTINGEIIDNDS